MPPTGFTFIEGGFPRNRRVSMNLIFSLISFAIHLVFSIVGPLYTQLHFIKNEKINQEVVLAIIFPEGGIVSLNFTHAHLIPFIN